MPAVKVGDVLAAWFSRGELPERVQLVVDQPLALLRRGAVLEWSEQARAYMTPAGDFCVLAAYVRRNWREVFGPVTEQVAA